MAILQNPITLPASKMLTAMTTLIGDLRFKDNLQISKVMNDLVASCEQGAVEFGKGIVYTFNVDFQPVEDLTETSSAFKLSKPVVGQETLTIDQYKFIPLSASQVLSRDAVLSGYQIDSFLALVMSLINKTHANYMFNICKDLYNSWEPKQATQTVEIEVKATTGLTGADLQNTLQYNASVIAKEMSIVAHNMSIPSSKFSDVPTYKGPDGTDLPVLTSVDSENMKIVWSDRFYTNFVADAMASLYHGEKIEGMIPGNLSIVLPTDAIEKKNEKTIAWLSDKSKFATANFYALSLSILDPSTTYQNYFFHFAYGAGVLSYPVGVKFVAKEA